MSLASWHDGPIRDAILHYLDRVTTEGGPDHVPPDERVAVFDNDGTLWCEKPTYLQAFFILQRLAAQAAADPELAARPVVRSLLAGDLAGAGAHGAAEMADVLLQTHAGLTTEEFDAEVLRWLRAYRHPRLDRSFAELVYVPMIELLDLLREHGFRVFVVTGGGVDFVRPVGARLYGVAPDDVVGSAVQVELERRDGRVVLVRRPALAGSPNEGAPKAVAIHAHIGQRPVVAVGNSAGDREMLEYAHTGRRPSLCLVLDHDDGDREYAYGGESVTNPHAEPILTTAQRFGWTVVSMRRDWSRVFA
jgi:phosphoglycolate phosphatase-like HAD superfamily hydrolase